MRVFTFILACFFLLVAAITFIVAVITQLFYYFG